MNDLTKLAQLAEQHSSSYASPHHFVLSVAGLRSIIAALAAQPGAVGEWKRVPVEPTPAMLVAMWDHRESMRGQSENRIARAGYAAMLAAAPTEAKPAQDAVDADLVKFARRWEMLAYMHTRGVPFSVYDHYIGNPERLDYAATLHREYLSGELERAAISAKKGGAA